MVADRRIGARYEAWKFSDTQLIVEAWWGVVVALHLVMLWRYGAAFAVGACVAAFSCIFLRTRGPRRAEPGPPQARPFLAAAGLGLAPHRAAVRCGGKVAIRGRRPTIAGGDLALRSIDAGEALAFARGNIASGGATPPS